VYCTAVNCVPCTYSNSTLSIPSFYHNSQEFLFKYTICVLNFQLTHVYIIYIHPHSMYRVLFTKSCIIRIITFCSLRIFSIDLIVFNYSNIVKNNIITILNLTEKGTSLEGGAGLKIWSGPAGILSVSQRASTRLIAHIIFVRCLTIIL